MLKKNAKIRKKWFLGNFRPLQVQMRSGEKKEGKNYQNILFQKIIYFFFHKIHVHACFQGWCQIFFDESIENLLPGGKLGSVVLAIKYSHFPLSTHDACPLSTNNIKKYACQKKCIAFLLFLWKRTIYHWHIFDIDTSKVNQNASFKEHCLCQCKFCYIRCNKNKLRFYTNYKN